MAVFSTTAIKKAASNINKGAVTKAKTLKNPGTLLKNPGRPNVTAVKAITKPKPVVTKKPTAQDYASQDPDYRRATAGYQLNLANFTARNNANKNDVNQDYATTRDRLVRQFSEDNSTQNSDFGNRGMFGSGVYAKSHNDQVRKQDEQSNGVNGDLEVSRDRNLRNLNFDEADAKSLEQQQEQTAMAGAIQRATAKIGLTGSVGKSSSSTKKPVKASAVKKAANNASKNNTKNNNTKKNTPAPKKKGK